ncbi:hypothetical protein F0562_017003 [Nyssa sinensis]|uniref:Uncharacterized protein n=1 Tax=Nyssa sinensis TaxID=561372 RepID=A0A5J4ZGM7_9ASTE|nr:hypothetical protein F0562_017003 [Nyssa sinensis]
MLKIDNVLHFERESSGGIANWVPSLSFIPPSPGHRLIGYEINAPEFIEYVTTYGGGYGIAGTYCEPLQSGQDGFFHDSISLSYRVEEADSENSPWHENELSDWGYEYDGSRQLVGDVRVMLWWLLGRRSILSLLCLFMIKILGLAMCLEFEYGEEEDCYGYGTEKPMSAYGNSSDEERLCESIFGYWPSVFGV